MAGTGRQGEDAPGAAFGRRTDRDLQLALDAAGMGWWHLDPVAQVAEADARCAEIFGISDRRRAGEAILSIVHPEDRARVEAALQAALDPAAPAPYSLVCRIVRPDGAVRWIEARGQAAFEGEGPARHATSMVGTVADVTSRLDVEARLAYLASFPERNPAPIVEADRSGRVRYANAAARRLFPEIGEQATAHPWLAGWEALAASIAAGGTATRSRAVTVGDRTYHQELVYSEADGLVRAYGVDVTEWRRAEQARRDNEERLRRAQEIAHLGSWEHDLVLDRLHWSDEAYRILGLAPRASPASYQAFLEMVHPDDRATVDAAHRGALQGRPDAVELVHRMVRPGTGEVRVVHEKWQRQEDAAGRTVKLLGTMLDITERHRAERALERSRLGLGRLAEASRAVMARTDLQGMLQVVAEAALALTGARLATCGHRLVDGRLEVVASARAEGAPPCPPGDMFRVAQGGVHLALLEGAQALRLDDVELRAHPRWWGLPAGHAPLRGLLGIAMLARAGQASGMILVSDKVDGPFTDEDESLLRQLATVASLALQHVEARVELEAADRQKDRFLAMLSHELRNPLAPIRNSLHLLAHAAPGSEQARRAQAVIDRQVAHLTRLVDDLLDVTRISSGKVQLHREPLDLVELVRGAIEDHRTELSSAGLEVRVALPPGPVPVEGDRTRLDQVLGNLLQNAVKFTPAGGAVTLTVGADERLRQALVRVRDTGAGIEAAMLPRLFQPFTQADATLDRSRGGLGLGLALARGLVEMHGGTLRAASEGPGKGAEFVISLPLRAGSAPAAGPAAAAPGREGAMRVLLVEDNPDAAESLREVLELLGHDVEVAHDGPAGLDRARRFRPDVVLCDVGLPGLDGYQVARALRAEHGPGAGLLVALTGYAAPDDLARSAAAGFDHHLAKPITIEALDRVLAGARRGP